VCVRWCFAAHLPRDTAYCAAIEKGETCGGSKDLRPRSFFRPDRVSALQNRLLSAMLSALGIADCLRFLVETESQVEIRAG